MEVVCAALELLSIVFRRTWHQGHSKWSSDVCLNERLITLAQGWGGQAQGLGLVDCVAMDEDMPRLDTCKLGKHICFRFLPDTGPSTSTSSSKGPVEIKLPWGGYRGMKNEHEVLEYLVREFKVPQCVKTRLSLLMRIRMSLLLPHIEGRRALSKLRLLALICVQHVRPNTHPGQLATMYSSEPELFTELIIIQREMGCVPENLRALALRAAGATVASRGRGSVVLLQQRSLASSVLNSLMRKVTSAMCKGDEGGEISESFAEALLALIAALVSSANGCTVLSEAGAVPSLLPLLDDLCESRILLVTHVVRVLEAFIDVSHTAADAFVELNGSDVLINRLEVEVNQVVQSKSVVNYNKRLLIKALLRAIGLACFGSGNPPVPQSSEDGPMARLLTSLADVFKLVEFFGGGVFSLAASVMAEHIHNDPRGFSTLEKVGLPTSFLQAIESGIPLTSDAICAVPGAAAALCLNERGKEAVCRSSAARFIVPVIESVVLGDLEALHAFHGQTASILGTSLDELMRHVPAICGDVVAGLVECLEIVAQRAGAGGMSAASAAAIPVTGSDKESNMFRAIEIMATLLDSSLAATPSATAFCEKGGLDKTLRLLCLPSGSITSGHVSEDQQINGKSAASLQYTFSQLIRGLIQRSNSPESASVEIAKALIAAIDSSTVEEPSAADSSGRTPLRTERSHKRGICISSSLRSESLTLLCSSMIKAWPSFVASFVSEGVYEKLGRLHSLANASLLELESDDRGNPAGAESENQKKLVRIVSASRNLMVTSVKACALPARGNISSIEVDQFARCLLKVWEERIHPPAEPQGRKRCLVLQHAVDELGVLLFDSRRHTCNVSVFPAFVDCLLHPLLNELVSVSELAASCGDELTEDVEKVVDSMVVLLEHTVSAPLLLSTSSSALVGNRTDIQGKPLTAVAFIENLKADVGRSVRRAMNASCGSSSSIRSGLVALLACAADPEGFAEEEEEELDFGPSIARQDQAPPESAILRIMETGFSRERAEAALRASSRDFRGILGGAGDILVNLAVEWLLSHTEEEIAAEEERHRQPPEPAPPIQDAKVKEGEGEKKPREESDSIWDLDLLQEAVSFLGNDGDAFALADLAHSLATRRRGHETKKVAELLLSMIRKQENIKLVAHACALLAAHDMKCHEALAGANAVNLVLDMLEKMQDQGKNNEDFMDALTALLVILTTMLQSKPHTQADGGTAIAKSGMKNREDGSMNCLQDSLEVGSASAGPSMASLETALADTAGSPMGYLDGMQQLRALNTSIQCIKVATQQGSSKAPFLAQAAIELVARLTRAPTLAKQFFMGGGVPLVVHLPSTCWFQNFEVIGAAILRHVVEDAGTLKARFGADIRKTLSSSPAQTDGQHRLLMRAFLQTHASQLSREPSVFLAAVEETCTLKRIGGRDYICLKEVQTEPDTDPKAADGRPSVQLFAKKEESPTCKRSKEKEKRDVEQLPKTPRRKVPSSFIFVIDQLVSVVQHFNSTPLSSDQMLDREQKSKKRKRDKKAQHEKGFVVGSEKEASSQEQDSAEGGTLYSKVEAARAAFCLDVLVSLLPYPGAVSLFLRRENGFLTHLLHDIVFQLSQPGQDADKALVAAQGARLLGSICLHSGEGRRRVFSDIATKLREEWQGPPLVLALVKSLLQPLDASQDTRSKLSRKAVAHAMQQSAVEAARSMRQFGLIHALLEILSHMDFSGPKASSQVESILSSLERIVRLSALNKTDKAAHVEEEKKGEFDQRGLDSAVDGVVAQISQILGSEHGLGADNQSIENRDYDSYTDDSEEDPDEDSMGAEVHLRGDDSQDDSDLMESELDEDDMEAGASDGEPPPIYRGIPEDSAEMTLDESDDEEEENEMQDEDEDEEDQDDEEDEFEEEDGSEDEGNYTDGEDELYEDRDVEFVTEGDLSAEEEELDREEELISEGDGGPVGDDIGMYYTEDELIDGDDLDDGEPQLIEVRWQMPARVRRTSSYMQDGVAGTEVDRQPPLRAMRRFRDLDSSANGQVNTGRRWQLRQSRSSQRNNFSAASSLVLTHPLLQRQSNEPGTNTDQSCETHLQGIAQTMLRGTAGPFSSLVHEAIGEVEGQHNQPEVARAQSMHRSMHGHPYVSVVSGVRDGGRYSGSSSASGRLRASLDYTLNPVLLEAPTESLHSNWAVANLGSRAMRSSLSTPTGDPAAVQDSLERHLRDRLRPPGLAEGTEGGPQNVSENAEAPDADGGNEHQQAPTTEQQITLELPGIVFPHTLTTPTPSAREAPQIEASTEPVAQSPGRDPVQEMQTEERSTGGGGAGGCHQVGSVDAPGVLDEQTLAAAQAAGIDPTVLAELPADLRSEIMASHMAVDYTRSRHNAEGQGMEGIALDPEFLAALPQDIAEEIRASRSVVGTGSASDMDNATILASFPPSLRREVLMTAGDNFLASLPSSLLAEAHTLRGHNRASEQVLDEAEDRAEDAPGPVGDEEITAMRNTMRELIAGTQRRIEQRLGSSQVTKKDKKEFRLDDDEEELIDSKGVSALVKLLRVAAPLRRGPLSLVLSNLAWHPKTCKEILRQLCLPLSAAESSTNGEDLFGLLGGETGVVYSKAPEGEGAPPLVTGRTLETLRQMSSLNKACANAMLSEKIACNGTRTVLQLVTSLLHRPLYRRSPLQLDSALRLIECLCTVASSIRKKLHLTREEEQVLQETALAASDPQFSAQVAAILGSLSVPSGTKSKCLSCLEATVSSSPVDASKNFISAFGEEIRSRATEATAVLSAVVEQHGQVEEIGNVGSAVLRLVRAALKVKKIIIGAVSESEMATAAAERHLKAILQEESKGSEHGKVEGKEDSHLEEEKASEGRNADLAQMKESSAEELALLQRNGKLLLQASNCVSSLESKLLLDLSSLWDSMDEMSTFIEGQMSSGSQSQSITFVQGGISAEVVGMQEGQPGRIAARLPPDAALVTPVIEAFFLLAGASCSDNTADASTSSQPAGVAGTKVTGRASLAPMLPSGSSSSGAVDLCQTGSAASNRPFSQFARTHRLLLNAILQRNAMLLQGAFAPLLQTPHLLDFGNKRAYFRGAVRALPSRSAGSLRLHIRRDHIFDDSYHQLRVRSPNELRGKLNIQFTGEEGVDAGGLTREWYQLLSREMFNVQNGLFEHSAEGSLQPSPGSAVQPDHLSFFRFAGRFVAKAVLDGHLVDVHFTRSFYKHLLGVPITYEDIEAVDPDFYKNLKWMLENSIDGVLDLTFSTEMTYFGKTDVVELKDGGLGIPVTDGNKAEYVNLISENRMTGAIRPQIKAFLEAFRELVPTDLTAVFNPSELELLISGLPHVDMEDLRANTEYSGYTIGSPVIQWFWDIVRDFGKVDKSRLIQFVTGTSKVPIGGFAELQGVSGPQKFQIHRSYKPKNSLPCAHTCFNQLDLVEYDSKEILKDRLLTAIREGSEGFGFA